MAVDGSGKKDRKRPRGSAREEGYATETCPATEMEREGPEEARAWLLQSRQLGFPISLRGPDGEVEEVLMIKFDITGLWN
ncbi:hypothetical protein E2562_005882 [Oryza meyeriana var. granulata]|uniref:Uncharacterized protein n=1 Tax=Oryza meyeriana var. granulata TaxID=110450 RepID=A0A6G1DV17_9ORYZ|nr:hypothetical protein E2562_005882 [Oryza meyeriana var. granulata]